MLRVGLLGAVEKLPHSTGAVCEPLEKVLERLAELSPRVEKLLHDERKLLHAE